jgi:hypothetical protein
LTSIAQASLRARRWERARPPSRYGFRRRRESMSRRGASREGRKLGEGGWPVPPRRCFSHQRMAHVCVQRQRRDIHCESATGRIRRGEPGAQPQELRQESASAEGAIHAQKEFLRNQSRGCSIETRLQRVVMGAAIGSWSVAPGSNVRGRLTRFAFGRIRPVFCAKGAIPSRAWGNAPGIMARHRKASAESATQLWYELGPGVD